MTLSSPAAASLGKSVSVVVFSLLARSFMGNIVRVERAPASQLEEEQEAEREWDASARVFRFLSSAPLQRSSSQPASFTAECSRSPVAGAVGPVRRGRRARARAPAVAPPVCFLYSLVSVDVVPAEGGVRRRSLVRSSCSASVVFA